MKDSEIRTLNKESLTPEVVLHNCLQSASKYEAVYIVAIAKNGPTELWFSSQLEFLPLAQLFLQDMALKMLKGQIIEERP
jgi:hypothetical protein